MHKIYLGLQDFACPIADYLLASVATSQALESLFTFLVTRIASSTYTLAAEHAKQTVFQLAVPKVENSNTKWDVRTPTVKQNTTMTLRPIQNINMFLAPTGSLPRP